MCNLHEPAPPLLGSTLLANEERLDMLRPSPLSSGLDTLDREALDGGFRYGEITAVAGASGTGKTLLVFQAIASHLIASEEGEVALIATSEPPLARLRDILLRRLDQQKREPEFCQSGYVYQKQVRTGGPPQDVQSQMTSMLERVRLSRVFDFPGVAEAIGEFGARLDEEEKTRRNRVDAKGFEKARGTAEGEERAENSLSVEEDNNTITRTTAANPEAAEYLPASMIVIDNIANVVGSMMTKSQAHGHAMLASCMRSLQHLTRRRNVCTVLVNAAAGLRQQNTQYHRRADDQASVFSSTLGKPALGKHFSYLIDTSIFLSTLPRSKEDADIAYNVAPVASGFTKVGVVEILKDRHGSREGRWSSFVTAAGIELQSIPS
ncbi:MAG: hypothetical protein LQ349_004554 [Xanthoria aureola]|nr:MAG: hypothetical protein LQ349_004554 [Xanthoria aureola]